MALFPLNHVLMIGRIFCLTGCGSGQAFMVTSMRDFNALSKSYWSTSSRNLLVVSSWFLEGNLMKVLTRYLRFLTTKVFHSLDLWIMGKEEEAVVVTNLAHELLMFILSSYSDIFDFQIYRSMSSEICQYCQIVLK